MSDLIIEVRNGGLGDHLFHSHLPRVAKQSGAYKRVFYSRLSAARTPEIVNLIWQTNPFLDGFVDSPGSVQLSRIDKQTHGNLLDAVMLQHGIDDGIRYHEPELFCDVRTTERFSDIAVYDPNYVSFVGAVDAAFIADFLAKRCLGQIVEIEPRKRHYSLGASVMGVRISSLLEYCQLIQSCRAFYCLTSGSATLAAALRKPSTVFYGYGQDPVFHHSRQHTYVLASSTALTTRARARLLRLRRKIFPE